MKESFAISLSIWVSNDGNKERAKEIETSFKALGAVRYAHAQLCSTPCETRNMLEEHIRDLEDHILEEIGLVARILAKSGRLRLVPGSCRPIMDAMRTRTTRTR